MFDQRFEEFGPSGFGRGGFGSWAGGGRMGRGSMEPAILGALMEKPMHGYEIISTLEAKSHGMWRPSPGSVYPTLQLLEEKGQVRSHEEDGKKVYEITDAGKIAAESERDEYEKMWREREAAFRGHQDPRADLRVTMKLMHKIVHKGTEAQKQALRSAFDDFNARLKEIAQGDK